MQDTLNIGPKNESLWDITTRWRARRFYATQKI